MEMRSGIDFAWVLQHACRHEAPELGPESRQHGRGWPIVARAGRGWPILLPSRRLRRDRTRTVGPRDAWSPRDADHRASVRVGGLRSTSDVSARGGSPRRIAISRRARSSKRRAEGIVAAMRSASPASSAQAAAIAASCADDMRGIARSRASPRVVAAARAPCAASTATNTRTVGGSPPEQGPRPSPRRSRRRPRPRPLRCARRCAPQSEPRATRDEARAT